MVEGREEIRYNENRKQTNCICEYTASKLYLKVTGPFH